jgi:hypothetical protein
MTRVRTCPLTKPLWQPRQACACRVRGTARRTRCRSSIRFRVLDAMFECADGRFVNLSWLEGRQLRAFADLVGLTPELERDGLLDESKLWCNGYHTEELRGRLAAMFKTRTAAEWARVANPAADLSDCKTTREWLHGEEHARASRAVVTLVDPEYGQTVQAGALFTMSKTPPEVERPRYALDADRNASLTEMEDQQQLDIIYTCVSCYGWDGPRGAARGHGISAPVARREGVAGPRPGCGGWSSGRLRGTPIRRTNPPNSPGGDNAAILGELRLSDRYAGSWRRA